MMVLELAKSWAKLLGLLWALSMVPPWLATTTERESESRLVSLWGRSWGLRTVQRLWETMKVMLLDGSSVKMLATSWELRKEQLWWATGLVMLWGGWKANQWGKLMVLSMGPQLSETVRALGSGWSWEQMWDFYLALPMAMLWGSQKATVSVMVWVTALASNDRN